MKALDFNAVILADGDFPSAEFPLRLLREAPHIVCCDGAARHISSPPKVGGVPEGWGGLSRHSIGLSRQSVTLIGDGDSVPDELRDRLIRVDEQDDNDLTKATRYCLSQGWRRIAYLGATGKREDHTLGNISLLVRYYLEMGITPLMATDYGWFVPARGTATFDSTPGQQVSLFNISCDHLSSEGLKWQAYPYRQFWQGTLNEAVGPSFTIEADSCYLVYRTYQ